MKVKKTLFLVVILLTILSTWQVSLVSGSEPPPPPSITVHKFHDVNGNGAQDVGEEDIPGWLIRIYRADHTGLYIVAEGYTGSDGTVTFSGDNIVVTSYKVWEEIRDCWEPTTPPGMGVWEDGYYTFVLLTWDNQSATVDFGNVDTCTPPPPPGCGTGTPGYWKNHPDAWPVEEITIGGVTYSKNDAIELMGMPEKGDKTFTMFRALVAAKLNVLVGNDDSCIADTIVAADAWMAEYGPVDDSEKVKGNSDAWRGGEPLSKELDDYNNGLLCAPHRD